MRSIPLLLACCICAAADPPAVRELVDRLKLLEAQIALIERESALPVDRAALWAGAVRGMVEAADPHGAYLPAAELAIHGLGTEPQRVALGFDWRRDDAGAVVTRVIPASPAASAGLHPGCRILAADGVAAAGDRRAFADAIARGRDRKLLRIRHVDGSERDLELERAELHDTGIAHLAREPGGVLHLRIGRFLPADAPTDALTATAAAVRSALSAAPPPRATILDLRGCSGGSLLAAIEVVSCWLPPDSEIIEQIGRDPSRARSFRSLGPRVSDAPVVVLVDGDTASAAEVAALAMRRGRRAPLIGMATLGKWSVQQLFLLPEGDAINLTVAHLRPPGGDALRSPLQPDIAVTQERSLTWLRWRDELAGKPDPAADPQLARAVELAATLALAEGR